MCGGDVVAVAGSTAPEFLKPTPTAEAKEGDLVVEEFPITFGGHTYPYGRIAFVKGRAPVPVVLVHHNYAGMKQFDVDQACFLARCGYVGIATDLYKAREGYDYEDRNPTEEATQERRIHCFKNAFDSMMDLLRSPKEWRGLMGTYLQAAFAHPAVASGRAGAIGYCLGGQCVLEQLRAGHGVQVLVSFHGLLHSRPTHNDEKYNSHKRIPKEKYETEVEVPPSTYTPDCILVVENGSLDGEVPLEDITEWMAEMDAGGVDWRFNNHGGAPHGWALGPACAGGGGNYREVTDRRSTKSMLAAFAEAWPDVAQYPVEANACGTALGKPAAP